MVGSGNAVNGASGLHMITAMFRDDDCFACVRSSKR